MSLIKCLNVSLSNVLHFTAPGCRFRYIAHNRCTSLISRMLQITRWFIRSAWRLCEWRVINKDAYKTRDKRESWTWRRCRAMYTTTSLTHFFIIRDQRVAATLGMRYFKLEFRGNTGRRYISIAKSSRRMPLRVGDTWRENSNRFIDLVIVNYDDSNRIIKSIIKRLNR